MQVCLSLKEITLKELDDLIKQGVLPSYINNRSSAVSYLISQTYDDLLGHVLERYDSTVR